MLRTVGGILAGLFVVGIALAFLEFLARRLIPGGSGGSMATGALLFIAFAYFIATLLGAAVAGAISGRKWAAWLIALLMLAASLLSLSQVSYPLWMEIVAIAAPLLAGLAATAFVRRCPAAGMGAPA